MTEFELVIAIVSVISATIFGIYIISKITGLIKTWINRNNNTYSDEEFEKLARAFVQHKKEIVKRIQNLEAIVTDESTESSKKLQEERKSIEIESEDSNQKEKKKESSGGNLRNMLRE